MTCWPKNQLYKDGENEERDGRERRHYKKGEPLKIMKFQIFRDDHFK